MTHKVVDALARSDRMLPVALTVVLAMASAAAGATASVYSPSVPARTVRTVEPFVRRMPEPPAPDEIFVKSASTDVVRTPLLAEHRCLAEVMYFEARGEGEKGERAVAEVVFHRIASGGHGRSICAVVYQGVSRAGCQFTFACDGSRSEAKSEEAWRQAEALAGRILTGKQGMNDETGGATSYHAVSVQPYWAEEMIRTAQIGNHIFYRSPGRPPEFETAALRGSI
jgi:spore germination cell wall hydrolase CwlJ-like protein